MRRPHRVLDLALYAVIGLAFVGAIALYALNSAHTNRPPALPLDWLMFAAMTALVFTNLIRQFWGSRSVRLWVTWSLILALHLGLLIPLIQAFHPVPMVWIALAGVAESVVIGEVIARVLGGPSGT